MPQYGLLLRVTHTGKAGDSVHVSDIRDGVDVLASFRKAGPVYIPTPAKGGQALLVYSGDVAISFETGGIRKFIEGGYLTAEFVIGDTLAPALFPEVQDEGVPVDTATTVFNFTGAGVTATQTAPGEVQIDVPGAGAGDHALLLNLPWLLSGHTGTPNRVAGFDGAGATRYYQIGVDLQAWDADLDGLAALATTGLVTRTGPATYTTTSLTLSGDVSGTLPGPLTVTDLTIAGEVQGSILYFNGINWVHLAPGLLGQVLTTQGGGANPLWATNAGGDVTGPGASTDNALVRWDGVTGKLIQNSNVLLTDAGNMTFTGGTTLSVDNIAEATVANGVVVNTVRNYGKSATDPVAPAPADGDIYYNTALRMQMYYDGFRGKWLSVETTEFMFGRDGATAVGQYYRTVDGRIMSASLGWYAVRSGTVVSLGYTRSNVANATFDIRRGGVSFATVGSAAAAGRDISLNADFLFGDVLAVLNAGANVTQDVIGWIRVKWRV